MTSDAGTVPSRWVWASLDAEQATGLWEELYEWVEWVRVRRELGTKIPACWFRHPPVVEELTALMAGWKAAYEVPGDGSGLPEAWAWYRQDMVSFLNHEFHPTVERLRSLSDFTNCRDGCGQPIAPKVDGSFGEVVAADVDARR